MNGLNAQTFSAAGLSAAHGAPAMTA